LVKCFGDVADRYCGRRPAFIAGKWVTRVGFVFEIDIFIERFVRGEGGGGWLEGLDEGFSVRKSE